MDVFDLRQWPGYAVAGGSLSDPAQVDHITIDSRRIYTPYTLFIALPGERQDGHQFVIQAAQAGAKYALVSTGWTPPPHLDLEAIKLLFVPDPLKAFQDIVKAYRLQLPTKFIGIVGSFGKTMVKDLLHILLATQKSVAASPESFNSQIGVPLSLLTIRKEHEIAIIEASISKKDEMDALTELVQPDYTILAPIGKKHLTTLENLPTIAQEIMKFVLATAKTGWILLPHDPLIQSYLHQMPCPHYFWDAQRSDLPSVSAHSQIAFPRPYEIQFPDNTHFQGLMSTGYSYFLNLMNMAVKAAWLCGISSQDIQEVLRFYQPEPMRTEMWKSPLGATIVSDTYCSDPQSIDQALRYFDYAAPKDKKIFVFGGIRGELPHLETDYRRIGKSLNKMKIDKLVLFGNKPFAPLIQETLETLPSSSIKVCKDYNDALAYLSQHTQPNDMILVKGEKKPSLDSLIEIFNGSVSNNQCVINLAAIRTNIKTLRTVLPPKTRVMVMVKALAYGTDDIRMAKFLATCGVDILGVSYVDEGIALKRAGVQQAIFSIYAANYEIAKVIKWQLEVGVSDREFIEKLAEETKKHNQVIKVHLHINTGMGRFGCRPEETLELARLIKNSSHLQLEGLMTHFACSDDPLEDAFTQQQIAIFDHAIAELKSHGIEAPWLHASNSSGAIRFRLPQYNMVRVGLVAYGLYASESAKKALDLRLALSLTSRIIGINVCKKGETISYGRNYTVERDVQKIAVLPVGYFDGLHRSYSGKSHVLIRGLKAPMVGNICMDYMMVDVTDIPNVHVGDKVLIFGEDEFGQYLSPEDLATRCNSIVHELITCLGPRIQRIFLYEEGHQIR